MRNILKERKYKNKQNILNNNITTKNKFRKINNNNGEDDININDNFKRFRKLIVHLKKRDNLRIDTKNNSYDNKNPRRDAQEV